jgi:hypothetical protein
MNIEFFSDKSGCFKPEAQLRERGTNNWLPVENFDPNKQHLLYMLFQDNPETQKILDYHRKRGTTDMVTLLKKVIDKKFSGLDPLPDIDENEFNFD